MLTPALDATLSRYGIGPRVRALRLRKGLGLVELGKHSGLSAALLSKIERGVLYPPLPTLLRIAMVFGVGLDHFFADERARTAVAVVRAQERRRLRDVHWRYESLDFAAHERRFNSFLAWFDPVPPGRLKLHHHPGVEFIHVLAGVLVLRILGQDRILRAGDSVYFDASAAHGYRRQGRRECRALVVTAP